MTGQMLDELSAAEAADLAARFGTPFYLYDSDLLSRRIARVRAAFHGLAEVYFAVKANPNLKLLRDIRGAADGLDISSAGELEQACLAGYDPSTLSFAGPAKTGEELRSAVERRVGVISVESARELNEIASHARASGIRAGIAVRVNPMRGIKAFGMKMGGRPVQFGVDEESLGEILHAVGDSLDAIDFRGVHVYAGSQCFDYAGMAECVADTLRIAREAEALGGRPCRFVNLGGGFGISHGDRDKELDVEALGAALVPELQDFTAGGERRVVFELGRYLAADAGLYVTRVISEKTSRGKSYFMLDGGLNHHLMAAGAFGTGLRANFISRNLTRPDADPLPCNLTGPSCNVTDLMALNTEVAGPQIGDLIAFGKSGAYGFSASPFLFLGHPTPAELVRQDGQVRLARSPRTILDFN